MSDVPSEVAPEVAETTPAGPSPAAGVPWWRRTWALVSAAVGVIGAVTGVIGVWPLLFRDATTLDSLTIAVESAESQLAPAFAVPISVDWASFPESPSRCDASQLAWLEANGRPLAQRHLVSVANVASEGAMLSLKGFRGEGEAMAVASHVAVTCDMTGAGASGLRTAVLDPASGTGAVYVQPDRSLPDNPLVFNLAPGENGQFALLLQSSADFRGRIVFAEALGAETREVELPLGVDVELPGLAPVQLSVVDGRLTCVTDAACDVDALLASFAAQG